MEEGKEEGRAFGGGGGDTVTQLVIEILAHRSNSDVIHQLPGVEFIRSFQGNLSYLTKLLVSNELAISPKFLEQHTDVTLRRNKEFQNQVLQILVKGFSMVFIAIWIFYHTRKDIVDANSFCKELTFEAASIFRVEFRDKCKATA